MPDSTSPGSAERLREHLETLKRLRGPAAIRPARLDEAKAWQAGRLARTYADLHAHPRYHQPTEFFLTDLYGPKDFSGRDDAMMRIHAVMVRMLPESAVETAALSIEVDALSESLDLRLTEALAPGPITELSYARAYRESGRPAERERQIALIEAVGQRLDQLVKKPMVYRTLRLMHAPARLAGLSDLQEFLERGFAAFKAMGGGEEFLALIGRREREIASRLFSGHPTPFSV